MRTTTSQQGKRCTWWRCLSSSFATALLAAAPLVASAQTGKATRNDGMVGAATLKGQTAEQILAAKVADKEVGSLNDPSKVFFFYNVKTGKFLSMGGYWGVHASLKDTPVAFWAQNGSSTAINFAQDLKTKQGSWMKWVENSNSTDEGVFLDRGSSLASIIPDTTVGSSKRIQPTQSITLIGSTPIQAKLRFGLANKSIFRRLETLHQRRTVMRTRKTTLSTADCGTSTPNGVSFP